MSGGLAPSKSTVYVGNLPYSLTNNDLHKIFEKFGKVVKVTIVKEKVSRRSKGVAFVLFLKKEDAQSCVRSTNGKQMFGRTIKTSIAKDNGRAPEFIRRRNYPDKSRCYECGDEGHLSYACSKNALGERDQPKKKERKRRRKDKDGRIIEESEEEEEDESTEVKKKKRKKKKKVQTDEEEEEEVGEEETFEPDLETLSAAIRLEQEQAELEKYRYQVATGEYGTETSEENRKKIRPSSYFSDEEDLSD